MNRGNGYGPSIFQNFRRNTACCGHQWFVSRKIVRMTNVRRCLSRFVVRPDDEVSGNDPELPLSFEIDWSSVKDITLGGTAVYFATTAMAPGEEAAIDPSSIVQKLEVGSEMERIARICGNRSDALASTESEWGRNEIRRLQARFPAD